jgi:hypothetical protein
MPYVFLCQINYLPKSKISDLLYYSVQFINMPSTGTDGLWEAGWDITYAEISQTHRFVKCFALFAHVG